MSRKRGGRGGAVDTSPADRTIGQNTEVRDKPAGETNTGMAYDGPLPGAGITVPSIRLSWTRVLTALVSIVGSVIVATVAVLGIMHGITGTMERIDDKVEGNGKQIEGCATQAPGTRRANHPAPALG